MANEPFTPEEMAKFLQWAPRKKRQRRTNYCKTVITDAGRLRDGFRTERKDCTVRALATAANVPYREAHEYMRVSGRLLGKGANLGFALNHPQGEVLRVGLYKVERLPSSAYSTGVQKHGGYFPRQLQEYFPRQRYWTVNQFIAAHPSGRFILTIPSHAFALIDGVIHDAYRITGRARIDGAWRFDQLITQSQVTELWERLNKLEAQ